MSLTLVEQLEITKGNVKPPSNPLMDMIHQGANITAQAFYSGYKDGIDEQANPKAVIYRDKMFRTSDQIFKHNQISIEGLLRIIVGLIGLSAYTFEQVQQADDDAWSGFLTTEMEKAFELFSGVKKDEKAQYEAII